MIATATRTQSARRPLNNLVQADLGRVIEPLADESVKGSPASVEAQRPRSAFLTALLRALSAKAA